jgi:hypothetical protein
MAGSRFLYLHEILTSPGAEYVEVGDAFVSFAIFIFLLFRLLPEEENS